jgi:hypothetical protein
VIVAIFLLLALAGEGRAITFGVKGGLNFANIKASPVTPDLPQFKTLPGFMGGVFVCFDVGPLAIQPELLYARRGTKVDLTIDSSPYTAEYRLDYFEGLLLLQWKILPAGPLKPVIFAGPSYGSLSKAKAVLFDASGSYVDSVDIKDMFKSGELAAVFGAGVELKLPFLKLFLEGRYHLGLFNIAASGFEGDSIKNKGLTMMMGVAF